MTHSQLLVPGVTRPNFDSTLELAWTAVVYQMAREIGGRVLNASEPPPPGPQRNYYRQHVSLADGEHAFVLLNTWIRLVACRRKVGRRDITGPFLDVPRGDLYELIGLRVALSAELEQEVRPEDLVGLGPDEVRDIEYYLPLRIGDVIYNWFD